MNFTTIVELLTKISFITLYLNTYMYVCLGEAEGCKEWKETPKSQIPTGANESQLS